MDKYNDFNFINAVMDLRQEAERQKKEAKEEVILLIMQNGKVTYTKITGLMMACAKNKKKIIEIEASNLFDTLTPYKTIQKEG